MVDKEINKNINDDFETEEIEKMKFLDSFISVNDDEKSLLVNKSTQEKILQNTLTEKELHSLIIILFSLSFLIFLRLCHTFHYPLFLIFQGLLLISVSLYGIKIKLPQIIQILQKIKPNKTKKYNQIENKENSELLQTLLI